MRKYAILSLMTLYIFLAFGGTCCFASDLDVFGPGGDGDDIGLSDAGSVWYYDYSTGIDISGDHAQVFLDSDGNIVGAMDPADNETEETELQDSVMIQSEIITRVEGILSGILLVNTGLETQAFTLQIGNATRQILLSGGNDEGVFIPDYMLVDQYDKIIGIRLFADPDDCIMKFRQVY